MASKIEIAGSGYQIPSPRIERILSHSKLALFFVASILFLGIYLPAEIATCNQTLVRTSEYVYNASCYCSNNVGGTPALAVAIFRDTDWYRQFGGMAAINPPSTGYQDISIQPGAVNFPRVESTVISVYLQFYFTLEWSNQVVHEKTVNMFDWYDPFNLTQQTGLSCQGPSKAGNSWIYYNTSDQCVQQVQEIFGLTINPNLTTGYSTNPTYQQACNLDYCEIPQCPTSQQVTIGFFCLTVIGVSYTLLQKFQMFFLWLWYKKYSIPTAATVPMVTSA